MKPEEKEKNITQELKKHKTLAMLAPSFVSDFDYPEIIYQLRALGFDKIVELTFGAKLVNREYHKILESPRYKKKLLISSVCPGIVETVRTKYPNYRKNLMPFVSPMIATAKICKKMYPKHKICFIAPCNFKKIEAKNTEVDFCIDNNELRNLINENKLEIEKKMRELKKKSFKQIGFDKFYNDYTKIYPLAGGLSKTAHLRGVLKPVEEIKIDGIVDVEKFLENPQKEIRFMDVTFCVGGCLGGSCIANKSLEDKKKRLMNYIEVAKEEKIPSGRKGLVKYAKGVKLSKKY